ncbi:MAG: hypothetical protein C4B59_00705 [Candidatus Methanogaster sp.]|uniref:Uncharacterized protein n=1 Tax=Candidatus Methanogaster sp. TaxID=3386292 RepID=A0AC61L751_9EURY|nr:MAG: hypothetical protein C4B59_00705 [ANME-2 cluster archaeon]
MSLLPIINGVYVGEDKAKRVVNMDIKVRNRRGSRNIKPLGFSILVAVILVLCAPSALAAYPDSNGNTKYEWITNVNFSEINETTGKETDGYGNYTNISARVSRGVSYNLSVTIHPDAFACYITAWIDWNQDEDFNDTDEKFVVANGSYTGGPHTVSITVPNGSTTTTRMRVSLKEGSEPPSYGPIGYGEVEDYSVQVSDPEPPIPELPTVALFSIGLLLLVGYVLRKK